MMVDMAITYSSSCYGHPGQLQSSTQEEGRGWMDESVHLCLASVRQLDGALTLKISCLSSDSLGLTLLASALEGVPETEARPANAFEAVDQSEPVGDEGPA
jgi:hypothetical protein